MRARIWSEMLQARHNHFCCTKLLAKQRSEIKWFNIIVLVFSAGGAMGWKFWDYFPAASCTIIAIIQIARLVESQILPSEKNIENLEQVISFYFRYNNEMEKLWYDHYNYRLEDKEAQDKFYELKEEEEEINKKVNKVVKKVSKKICKESDEETRNYLKQNFNIQL